MVLRMMRYFGQSREYWEENLDLGFYNEAVDFLIQEPPIDTLYARVKGYKAPTKKENIKSMPANMGLPEFEE